MSTAVAGYPAEWEESELLALIWAGPLFKELIYIANADAADLRDETGEFIPIHKLPRHVTAAIAGIKMDKDTGRITDIELWPAEKARGTLRRLKCFGAA